jgi:hypothetical protein
MLLAIALIALGSPVNATTAQPISIAVVDAPSIPIETTAQAPNACGDDAYSTIAGPWTKTLKWWYKSASTPSYLATNGVVGKIKDSFDNMTGAHNDCGLLDTVSATAAYQGTTTTSPNINKRGYCNPSDGKNVIGFGRLPAGILAVTCIWTGSGGHIREADIRMNSNFDWELSPANCYYEELVEPTMTHEIGHAFGMGHVGEKKHGRLTMSTTSDGPCSNSESSLGWGDVRGMHHLYP